MKVAVFSSQRYDRCALEEANEALRHDLTFLDVRLTSQTAVLASGFPAVCCFVSDQLDAATIRILAAQGVRLIALRSAGFNHVDLAATAACGLRVTRVPEYSPYAVAEHAFALILMLNRKVHRAFQRV